ncbi:MAG: hypothetical protein PVJ21_01115 [Anaerolineales bacterium]
MVTKKLVANEKPPVREVEARPDVNVRAISQRTVNRPGGLARRASALSLSHSWAGGF